MSKKLSILIIITAISCSFFYPQPSLAAVDLIKTPNSPTVYYVDKNNIRHAFPNQITYQSWFGNDFSSVMTMSTDYVSSLGLGKNITLKSGKYLAKVPSSPKVYAIEPGGTLRHVVSADVAEKIYGKNWQQKLVDLPEVFFENYVLGKPIKKEHHIPDGVVYKLTNKNDYYYKTRGHVKKFASWSDVLANGYDEQDVVEHITTFLLHGKEIKGHDSQINNLIIQNNLGKYDCENRNLKGAFVFIYEDNYTPKKLNKIKNIKNKLPAYFNWATDELSELILEDEIFIIKKEDYHIVENDLSMQQVGYDFYNEHQDVYDFLFIFDNFSPSSKTIAEHHSVTNQIKGIHKPLLKAEVQYGSLGKLKGIVNMFNIKKHSFEIEQEQNNTLNNIVHETLHQWSGSLIFLNENIKDDTSLLDKKGVHWSHYVNFSSPLGGYGWQDNSDGTFTQNHTSPQLKLCNLDLYAMGLLPVRGIGELFYIIPEDDLITATISATRVDVDPQKLVDAMGEWGCVVE